MPARLTVRGMCLVVLLLPAAALGLAVHPAAGAGPTYVAGHIGVDTVWDPAGNPFIATGSVTVDNGATLTILPGVEVRFELYRALYVEGVLVAVGEAMNPIRLTSNLTPPKPGDWLGIKFNASAAAGNSVLRNCLIEWPANGIWLEQTSPEVSDVLVNDPLMKGVYLQNSNATLMNVSVARSRGTGLQFAGGSPQLLNSSVDSASFEAVFLTATMANLAHVEIRGSMSGIVCLRSTLAIRDAAIQGAQDALTADGCTVSVRNLTTSSSTRGLVASSDSEVDATALRIDATQTGAYADLSTLTISNSTIGGTALDLQLAESSNVSLLNTTLSESGLAVAPSSTLTVRNFLTVRVENRSHDPVLGAHVASWDNSLSSADCWTDSGGTCGPSEVTDRIYHGSATATENETLIRVDFSGMEFAANPRSVNMAKSHLEVFRPPNSPPQVFIVEPGPGRTAWRNVSISGSAEDPDGIIVSVELKIGTSPWLNLTVTPGRNVSWTHQWDSWTAPNGPVYLLARATDDEGGWIVSSLAVAIDNRLPEVAVTSHHGGETVHGIVTVEGRATSLRGNVTLVEVKVGSGAWVRATAKTANWTAWSFTFDTRRFPDNDTVLQIRVSDDQPASGILTFALRFANKAQQPSFDPWLLVLLTAVGLGVALVLMVLRRRKHRATEGATEKVPPATRGDMKAVNPGPQQAVVFECPACGTQVEAEDLRCPACGAHFED